MTLTPQSARLPAGPPPGFPGCPKCPYVHTGPARICVACAGRTFEMIPRDACPLCSQLLDTDGTCPNWLCSDSARRISRIHAISYQSGALRHVISRYKYDAKHGWALIFGRLVLGWLEAYGGASPPGLIVANPTYVSPGGRSFGHTELVLDVAAREDARRAWPFDVASPRAIVKTRATSQSASATATAKRAAAAELRQALAIPDPSRTAGRRILVYDDVCTTASQLNAVADCLLADGQAAHVEALVLARAPWRRRTLPRRASVARACGPDRRTARGSRGNADRGLSPAAATVELSRESPGATLEAATCLDSTRSRGSRSGRMTRRGRSGSTTRYSAGRSLTTLRRAVTRRTR
jgi:predicted amidophosphoribosyltransferase